MSLRVVSLIASSTESMCALDLGHLLVGRSHECDFPLWVNDLPVCSSPQFSLEGTSRDIDERVRQIVQQGLSVYHVDVDMLNALRPDVIITQDHCEVCAVSLKDLDDAVCHVLETRPQMVVLAPHTLADIYEGIYQMADACQRPQAADVLLAQMTASLDALHQQTVAATAGKQKLGVAILEWIDPIWTSGGWIPELVELAGAVDVLGKAGQRSKAISFEDLEQADPDVIVVAPCGYDIPKSRQEMRPLLTHPRWHQLRAVCSGQVYLANGNYYFNRPSHRVVDSTRILAEILYPHVFPPSKTEDWIPLSAVEQYVA